MGTSMKLSIWILLVFGLKGIALVKYAVFENLFMALNNLLKHGLVASMRWCYLWALFVVILIIHVLFSVVLRGSVSFLYMWMILLLLGMMHRVLLKLSKPLGKSLM